MVLLLFLFGLALGAELPSAEPEMVLQCGSCPPFWFNFNDRCYKYISTLMSWADAELHCVSQGANLVSIHSPAEENFIKTLIKNFDHNEGYTWIGLSDEHKEGSMMWSDGCAVNFRFWALGEPNNNNGDEHCVHTNFETEQKWNDRPCSSTYTSVCASRIFCPN